MALVEYGGAKMYEREFYDILSSNERLIWSDRPNKTIHLLKGLPMFVIGIIWGIIDIGIILAIGGSAPLFFIGPFMLLHMMPLWIGVGNMIRLLLSYENVYFAYTDKRVIIRSGIWGIDYKSIALDSITDIEVNVNPIENSRNLGSLIINDSYIGHGDNRRRVMNKLYGISNPYEVYKNLKKISLDIRSDINYPNELRPENNPGYKTEYKG